MKGLPDFVRGRNPAQLALSLLGVGLPQCPDIAQANDVVTRWKAVELKRAFRARALATHPDRGGDAEAFKQVAWAYDFLKTNVRALRQEEVDWLKAKRDAQRAYQERVRKMRDELARVGDAADAFGYAMGAASSTSTTTGTVSQVRITIHSFGGGWRRN